MASLVSTRSRMVSLEAPQRKSPATSRPALQFKVPASDSEESPRSPMSGKNQHGRGAELESQLALHQEGVKKAKEQLNASETCKRRAQQDAEDAKKQLPAMATKLEESEQQLMELSASVDSRFQGPREISQDRDRARQSGLEAVQKQHSMDSAAYASALNGIQNLKIQLETAYGSEAVQTEHAESAHPDTQKSGIELSEILSLVEDLKTDVVKCRESEAVNRTQMQLETARETVGKLPSDSKEATDAYQLSLKLEQSKARIQSLEEGVSKLQFVLLNRIIKQLDPENDVGNRSKGDLEAVNIVQIQLERLNETVEKLRSDSDEATDACQLLLLELEQSEARIQSLEKLRLGLYHGIMEDPEGDVGSLSKGEDEERNKLDDELNATKLEMRTLRARSPYGQGEHVKAEYAQRDAGLEAELEKAKAEIEELKTSLVQKESELCNAKGENAVLNTKIYELSERECELKDDVEELAAGLERLKLRLSASDRVLDSVPQQIGWLYMEIRKTNSKVTTVGGAVTGGYQEALLKPGCSSEEAVKSSRRVECVTEQLAAAQALKTKLEDELRRMRVQSDQLRKAAEEAAMISTGKNAKFIQKTRSLDRHRNPVYFKGIDNDSPKKKNGNMWKRFVATKNMAVLGKKGQK